MNRVTLVRLFPVLAAVAFGACSGSGNSSELKTGGEFVVLKTEPSDNATLFLNDPIRIDFSNKVDLDSVDLTTFAFQVLDQFGNTVAEPVAGTFALGTSPGDTDPGRRLLFNPRLPTNDLFTNGGFRPGRTYIVQLVGGSAVSGTVIRDQGHRPLARPISFRFNTSDGTTPAQLFRNTAGGGPRLVSGVAITPTPDQDGRVSLNKLGAPPVEVRLRFNQPLNPASTNVPVALDTDPLVRNNNNRGRIYLQYDDPVLGEGWWIPADVELEDNSVDGATVVLRPVGVLPNNVDATNGGIEVIVESTLEDISGESNVSLGLSYNRIVDRFFTRRAFEQQFDGIVEDFLASSHTDPKAVFGEPMAEVGPGFLKAGFDFEGSATGADFNPDQDYTLNTDFTQVVPSNGPAFNVSGGVFNFRNVTIGTGRTITGQGQNPMVWLVSGTFTVAGTLTVKGGKAPLVLSSGNAYLPKAGGFGSCGGGDGGAGSPSTSQRDERGGTGKGPLNAPGQGGAGGALACQPGLTRGSGGGGGSFVTQGDPNFKRKIGAPNPPQPLFATFQQQIGIGGNGGSGTAGASTRTLAGGVPGPTTFVDARDDNNFWGVGIRLDGTPLRITGELAAPQGGGGGGGGGDLSYNTSCNIGDEGFGNDASGGGGGGGGGALIVKALGPIVIQGQIIADGGGGAGGEQSGSSNKGGGGGGGAGGMVVLMSASNIDIRIRNGTGGYLYGSPVATPVQNNYDFAISADGGVCETGSVSPTGGAPLQVRKYRFGTTAVTTADQAGYPTGYDQAPLGGFGGMGIVQLMAPPGTNADNTNTVLDDNINLFAGSFQLTSTAPPASTGLPALLTKQAALAWRGFPAAVGFIDDFNNPVNIGDNEGDIRPAPILLPVPFSSKSRARSKWIDTGSSVRQATDSTDPRFIQAPGVLGPRYEFAGLRTDADLGFGYARYTATGGAATVNYPIVVAATPILTTFLNSSFLGQPAYRVQLTAPVLGADVDRYSQYEADALTAGGTQLASFRILSHTDRELVLSTESGAFPTGAAQMRVRAKFFEVVTDGVTGLGPTYQGAGGDRLPIANVKIGFAFHTNPADPINGVRYPTTGFEYDLANPTVQETIRALGASFVQYDVLFDSAFRRVAGGTGGDNPPPLAPTSPRPELHFLRLPYRY